MNTTTLKDTVMSDTNWQCKEGDPFKADITYRLRNNYAQELCFNAMREPTIYAEAAGHIEAQQQRIEALERELAEASKDAELMGIVRSLCCVADSASQPNNGDYAQLALCDASPLMIAARQACIDRGFTAGGLSIDAAMKEQA